MSTRNECFTDEEVLEIRHMRYLFRMSMRDLGEMYERNHSSISLLIRGKTYPGVGGPIEPGRRSPGTGRAKKSHH